MSRYGTVRVKDRDSGATARSVLHYPPVAALNRSANGRPVRMPGLPRHAKRTGEGHGLRTTLTQPSALSWNVS